jgi:hypothetical protein
MADFTYIVASDVNPRDGLGLELWKDGEQLGEIFRSDEHRSMTISLWKQYLPLEVIERFIADARDRLLPYSDD